MLDRSICSPICPSGRERRSSLRPSALPRCHDGNDDDADEVRESPSPSEASVIDPTRISAITPTATPARASIVTLRRIDQVSPTKRRSPHPRWGCTDPDVSPARRSGRRNTWRGGPPPGRHAGEAARKSTARSTGDGGPANSHQLEECRHHQGDGGEQKHQRLDVRRCAVEAPADEHRPAHHQQYVAEDGADQRGLDDFVQSRREREARDD